MSRKRGRPKKVRDPRPIPKMLNGILYRSTLEACYSVFWEDLGLGPDYEVEAVDLGGMSYLPDFYLHSLGLYQEIKPVRPGIENPVHRVLAAMAAATGKPVLLTWGTPSYQTRLPVVERALLWISEGTTAISTSVRGLLEARGISKDSMARAVITAHRTVRWDCPDIAPDLKGLATKWAATRTR